MSSATTVVCPRCYSSLPGELCNTGMPVGCPSCDSRILVEIFPAFFKLAGTGQTAETILEESVSSCFYHEKKKAVVHCDGCGRFLCALCDLDLIGRHLCPPCLQTSRKKGQVPQFENRRMIYDGAALSTALLPLIIWPLTLVTAPVAIYLAIVSFFRPSSLIPRTRIRAYLALGFGLLEVLVWVLVFYKLAQSS